MKKVPWLVEAGQGTERNEMKQYDRMGPTPKAERRGTRVLRRYRKAKKRRGAMEEHPGIVLLMAWGSAMVAGIVANMTGIGAIGLVTFVICILSCYM